MPNSHLNRSRNTVFDMWHFFASSSPVIFAVTRKRTVSLKPAPLKSGIYFSDYIHAQPLADESAEKSRKDADELYLTFTYPDVLRRKNIDEDSHYANECRFTALFKMIGYGATGLYPNLSAHWEELQQDINNYVSILSKEK